jgi:hypothetical protein
MTVKELSILLSELDQTKEIRFFDYEQIPDIPICGVTLWKYKDIEYYCLYEVFERKI